MLTGPSSVKLRNKGDVSFLGSEREAVKSKPMTIGTRMHATGMPIKTSKEPSAGKKSDKTAKQLLGELYADKEYLEKLLRNDGKVIISLPTCYWFVTKHFIVEFISNKFTSFLQFTY